MELKQTELIPEIKRLCLAGEYDKAISLTSALEDKVIAAKAHLLCIECEQATNRGRQ